MFYAEQTERFVAPRERADGRVLRIVAPFAPAVILSAILLLPVPIMAQVVINRVNGLATDQSGSAIVGASVTAREINTGAVTETKTSERGYYLMQLPVGTYNVSCSNTGFQTIKREKVPVDVGADVSLDFKLSLATAQQTVEVV